MSMKTWRDKYYPVEAFKVPKADAVEHSYRKWLGARPKNLKQHGLYRDGDRVLEIGGKSEFCFNIFTCSLCYHYMDATAVECVTCPLTIVLGYPCDEYINSPFLKWSLTGDPEPMIKALRKAKTMKEVKQ